MSLGETIHNVESGAFVALYSAHLQGQAANQARRQASQDNAVDAVDRLGQALLASRRREAALQREVAALRSRPGARPLDFGRGLSARPLDFGQGLSARRG